MLAWLFCKELIHPAEAGRRAVLNAIASMQPLHATLDMLTVDRHLGERAATLAIFSYS